MTFRDYVELLYKAYLEDREIIKRLRDKMKDGSYLQDLEDDPGLQDWENINPRAIDPRQRGRSKYYPNPIDPQQGVRVYESRSKRAARKILDAVKRRDRLDIKIISKNTENNLKQILAKTDFLNYEQYLEARTAADLKLLKQNKRLML